MNIRPPYGRPLRWTAVVFLIWTLGGLWTFAYGPQALTRMTEASLRLAPASLRVVLLDYRGDLEKGIRQGLDVTYDLPEAIEDRAERLSSTMRKGGDFSRIAREFGVLAGMIFRLHDPFRNQPDPLGSLEGDYWGYADRILPKLIPTFDGHDSPPIGDSPRTYFQSRLRMQERYRSAIQVSYFPKGKRVSSKTFDDLSNAFGAAQAVLSHAISDTAKLWLVTWAAMDGDLSGTPYYHPKRSKAKEKGS